MHRYGIIVYRSDEDEAYIADVPELSGCMAGVCEGEPKLRAGGAAAAGDEAI